MHDYSTDVCMIYRPWVPAVSEYLARRHPRIWRQIDTSGIAYVSVQTLLELCKRFRQGGFGWGRVSLEEGRERFRRARGRDWPCRT